MQVSEAVLLKHPYRIDFPDGMHIRFFSELCGAQSARTHSLPMFNERTKEVFSAGRCREIAREWEDRLPRVQ
jgi:hypothetical protein